MSRCQLEKKCFEKISDAYLKDILRSGEVKVHATDSEGNWWKRVNLRAVKRVLCVRGRCGGRRESEEGGGGEREREQKIERGQDDTMSYMQLHCRRMLLSNKSIRYNNTRLFCK